MKMSKNKLIKIVSLFMSIIFTICTFFSIDAGAAEQVYEENLHITKEEAYEYAEMHATEYISTFLALSTTGVAGCLNEASTFSLGNGFYSYVYNGNTIEQGDIVYFPIIQNDKVVLLLSIAKTDGVLNGSASVYLVDELNSYDFVYKKPLLVTYDTNNFLMYNDSFVTIGVTSLSDTKLIEIEEQLNDILCDTPEIIESDELNYIVDLGFVDNPIVEDGIMTLAQVPGFNIWTDNYKLLEMANCTVDQKGPDGTSRGLCWAAAAVSVIRYRSGGYRSLKPWQVADALRIGYDKGGTLTDMETALLYYLNDAQHDKYTGKNRAAQSMTEVQHNINNAFPIIMVGHTRVPGIPNFLEAGHAVTIIGYNDNQIIYWNSATLQITSIAFGGSTTSFLNGGSKIYVWDQSVLIPLQ